MIISKSEIQSFHIARAEALDAYNLLEQGLGITLAQLLSEHPKFGSLVMSKMINTRARNEVVQKVIDHKSGKAFRPFTNSLFAEIATVDLKRNQLVHWHQNLLGDDGLYLRPTDFMSDSADKMTKEDMIEMGKKCAFLSRALLLLRAHMRDTSRYPTLRERFAEPLRYPPEPDDLLSHYPIDSLSPLQSFGA